MATLAALPALPHAAEVIDLRPGYWEAVWTYPDKSMAKEFTCLTPEELEKMRFFLPTQEGCTVSTGSQSRTHYEATAVCVEKAQSMKIRWVFEARDRMSFTAVATYEVKGKNATANATFRWLQESCNVSGVPIS